VPIATTESYVNNVATLLLNVTKLMRYFQRFSDVL